MSGVPTHNSTGGARMTTRQTTLEEWGMTFEPLEEEQPKPTRQTTIWEWFKDKVRRAHVKRGGEDIWGLDDESD
tara:strand:- start:2929 stop:3150 length:222 start_codon:yes stop_codon:yes gene_type:complete